MNSKGHRTPRIRSLSFSAPLLATLAAAPAASAATIRVPADQATIQAGIDAASAGDTVLVAPGTYSGAGNRDLDFGGVDLVLLGDGFPEDVVIDGNSEVDGNARGFILQNGETSAAVIRNFTIRNCWAPMEGPAAYTGGGILLDGAGPTLELILFEGNNANGGSGAGVACLNGASPSLYNCHFYDNYTNNYGSAVYCGPGSSPEIENCTMFLNRGNGAIAGGNTSPVIFDCGLGGNSGIDSRGGAAFRFWGASDATVIASLVTGNKANSTARGGSALLLLDTAVVHMEGVTIAGNYSADVGGAVLLASGSDASLFMTTSILWGNCAGNDGDQIYLDSATGTVDLECTVIDSTGVTAPGTLYTDCIFDDPLFCNPGDCSLTPSIEGEYTVAMTSPAVPENNACGVWLGLPGVGCGDVTAVRETTWGKLKTLYQDH